MWNKIINNDVELAIKENLKGNTVYVVNFESEDMTSLEEMDLYDIKYSAKNKNCMFFTNSTTEND